MRRKGPFLCVLLAALALAGCCCSHPVEVGSLRDVETKQEKYFGKYLKYVEADPSLNAAQKNDERAVTEAVKRQTTSVRKSLDGKD